MTRISRHSNFYLLSMVVDWSVTENVERGDGCVNREGTMN
jgi:hypothetical protein